MEFLGFTINPTHLLNTGMEMAGKVVLALLIFFIGKWIVKKVVLVAEKLMERSKLDNTVANFLSNLLYGLLLVVVILAALSKIGVNTTSVVAILGGAAVAIGISLKDQLSNFAAGVMIVIFRPFNRGDFVNINGNEGTVREITLVNTRLSTLNNYEIIIPNGEITTNSTINYTSLPNRRVDVTVGIGYGADIKTAKELMLSIARSNEMVFADPEPLVRVVNLGDNSVDLMLCVWCLNENWYQLQCDLMEDIKYALDDKDIEIPFPQRSVHVEGLDKLLKAVNTNAKPTSHADTAAEKVQSAENTDQ